MVGAPGFDRTANDQGAVYVYYYLPNDPNGCDCGGTWTRSGSRLEAANPAGSDPVNGPWADQFGYAVAIANGRIVVGMPGYNETQPGVRNDVGAIRTYTTTGTLPAGAPLAEILVNSSSTEPGYGYKTLYDPSWRMLFVGAPDQGKVYVYVNEGLYWRAYGQLSSWNQISGFHPTFGADMDLDGNQLVVGQPGTNQVFVYTVTSDPVTSWVMRDLPNPPGMTETHGSQFGASVAISGNRIVVGAPNATVCYSSAGQPHAGYCLPLTTSGAAFSYVKNGSDWTLDKFLMPYDPNMPDDTSVTISARDPDPWARFDGVGSIQLYEDDPKYDINGHGYDPLRSIMVGPRTTVKVWCYWGGEDSHSNNSYSNGEEWTGWSCSYNNIAFAEVYANDPRSYVQDKTFDALNNAQFGASVDIVGTTVVVGAPGKGRVLLYDLTQSNYTHWTTNYGAPLKPSYNIDGNGKFGSEVVISGTHPFIGASEADDANPGSTKEGALFCDVIADACGLSPTPQTNGKFGDTNTIGLSWNGTYMLVGAPGEANGNAHLYRVGPLQLTNILSLSSDGTPTFGYGVSIISEGHYVVDTRDQGKLFNFRQRGPEWSAVAGLLVPDRVPPALFGTAVVIDGNTAVVGAPHFDGRGAAFVFVRDGSVGDGDDMDYWSLQSKVQSRDIQPGDEFGASVALSGDTLIVGAPSKSSSTGAAYIFERLGVTWIPQANLHDIVSLSANGKFGAAVDIDADTAIVGAPVANKAYIFTRSGTAWSSQWTRTESGGYGTSVAIDGNTAVIGAPSANSNKGATYVYNRTGTSWSAPTTLTASNGAAGDQFGQAVDVEGKHIVVGAPGVLSSQGTAYTFFYTGTTWNQQQILTGVAAGDQFGAAVAIDHDLLVVGAPGVSSSQGAAYSYGLKAYKSTDALPATCNRTLEGKCWRLETVENPLYGPDAAAGDGVGFAVALSGWNVVAGAPQLSGRGTDGAGYAYIRDVSPPLIVTIPTITDVVKSGAQAMTIEGTVGGMETASLRVFDIKSVTVTLTSALTNTLTINPAGITAYGLQNFTVSGTSGADTLRVLAPNFALPTAQTYGVSVGGSSAVTLTTTFNFNGSAGSDTLETILDIDLNLYSNKLVSSLGGEILLAGVENARLIGGDSVNRFIVNSWTGTGGVATLDGKGGSDQYQVLISAIDNVAVLNTGAGDSDRLTVIGTTGNDAFFVATNAATQTGRTVQYSGIGVLRIAGMTGDDTMTVENTSAGNVVLDGQDGSDTYNVNVCGSHANVTLSDTGNVGDDRLNINGGAGDDTFAVYGDHTTCNAAAGIDGTATIYYDTSGEYFTVNGLGGDDKFDIRGVPTNAAHNRAYVYGGDGDDWFDIDGAYPDGITLDGQGGSDSYRPAGSAIGYTIGESGTGAADRDYVVPVDTSTWTGELTLTGNQLTSSGGGSYTLPGAFVSGTAGIEGYNIPMPAGSNVTISGLATNYPVALTASGGNNTFTITDLSALSSAPTLRIFGGTGNDTLNLTATASGSVGTLTDGQLSGLGLTNPLQFHDLEQFNLTTGSGDDYITINYTPGMSVTLDTDLPSSGSDWVYVNGTAAADTIALDNTTLNINGSNVTLTNVEHLVVNAGSGDDAFSVTSIPSVMTALLNGESGTNSLTGPNVAATWNITGTNGGNINGAQLVFTGIQNLIGTSANDVLNYASYPSAVSVNLVTGSATGIGTFAHFESIVGKGAGTTLTAAGVWHITGTDAGNVGGVAFSNIPNLTGSVGADTFSFEGGGNITGNLDGAGGTDTLDYSTLAVGVTVNLQTSKAAQIGGTFSNIEVVTGTTHADTLIGANTGNVWMLTGNNAGNVNGFVFSLIETITGGTSSDTLVGPNVANTWTLSSNSTGNVNGLVFSSIETLTGGTASDELRGRNVANTWTLLNNTAGDVNGLVFSSIETITGGSASDTLVGPNSANTWTLTGDYAGTVGTLAFSSIEAITGGTASDELRGRNVANTWTLTSHSAGNVNGLGFSAIEAITGGSASDTLIGPNGANTWTLTSHSAGNVNGLAFSAMEAIAGGTLDDTLVGPSTANIWTLTGSNTGNVNGLAFSAIENLIGNTDTDRFAFNDGAHISGNVNGSGGSDTLDLSKFAYNHPITVNLQTGTIMALLGGVNTNIVGGTFTSIETITGGIGTDSLIGANAANGWNITGNNQGTVGTLAFASFENLTGGSSTDTFIFGNGVGISGNLDGIGDNNTLNYAAYSTGNWVTVNLATQKATGIGGTFAHVSTLIGGAGSDTLVGANAANAWNITGANSGEFGGTLGFSGIENLTGGSGADTFTFGNGGSVSGNIDGAAGSDVLNYAAINASVNINLQARSATFVGGTFGNIESFVGGTGTDALIGANGTYTWTLTGNNQGTVGSVAFSAFETLTGGTGTDMLIGANVVNTWIITRANSGELGVVDPEFPSGGTLEFSGMENLTGGANDDTFVFAVGGSVSGIVKGGAEVLADTLDYSNNGGAAVTINLRLAHATSTGGIVGIEKLIGSSNGGDRLVGADVTNTWNITGNNTGTVGTLGFSEFENLTGGVITDTFVFSGGSVTGNVDGASGADELNYIAFSSVATINLQTRTANDIGGTFTGIESFTGSASTDTLIGADTATTWNITGNNAGDIGGYAFNSFENLIGGAAADTFTFASTGNVAGSVNGTGGSDELVFTMTVGVDLVTIAYPQVTRAIGATTYMGIETLSVNAGDGLDHVTVNIGGSGFPAIINITTGNDDDLVTVNLATGVTTRINIDSGAPSASDSVTVYGTAGDDTIAINDMTLTFGGVTLPITATEDYTISGGLGNDHLSAAGTTVNGTLTLLGDEGDDEIALNYPIVTGELEVEGGSGTNTLLVSTSDNADVITLTNTTVAVNGSTTAEYEDVSVVILNAWKGADNITIASTIAGATTVNGGDDGDSILVQSASGALTINAGSGDDSIRLATVASFAVDGDDGSDTLIGPDANTTWTVSSANAGMLTGGITFASFENLTGGSATDTFVFADGSGVAGIVNGGAGNDTISFANYSAANPVTISLQSSTVTNMAGMANIETIVGGAGNDTLIGANAANTWNITGVNSGELGVVDPAFPSGGTLEFSEIENLVGGTFADTFAFASTGNVTGTVDGAAGADELRFDMTSDVDNVTITAPQINRAVGTTTYANVETVTLNADAGADIITVTPTVVGFPATVNVNLDDGDDVITVNLAAGATTTINLDGGVPSASDSLTVNGTASGDAIAVSSLSVTFGATTIALTAVENLTVAAGSGDDALSLIGTSVPGTLALLGEVGSDTITVNYPVTTGTLIVDGSANTNDALIVSTTANADNIVLSGTTLAVTGATTANYVGFASLTLNTLGNTDQVTITNTHTGTTTINSGDSNDTITVQATSGALIVNAGAGDDTINVQSIGAVATINGGSGSDTINVSSDAPLNTGVLTGLLATLIVDGNGGGTDTLNISESGSGVADTIRMDTNGGVLASAVVPFTIQFGGSAAFTGGVHLWTGSAGDTINLRNVYANEPVTINAGAGDDTINVSSNAPTNTGTLNAIYDLLTIDGDAGNDTLNVSDAGDAASNLGTLTATTLTGLDMTNGITYGTVETLSITLGSGGNTFNVQSTASGVSTTVNGGSGDETFNVGASGSLDQILGVLFLNGNDPTASDVLNINDQGDADGNVYTLTATTIDRTGAAQITYGTIGQLNINSASGGDTFMIQSTHSNSTTLNTGVGTDTITLNGTSGTTTVNAGANADAFVINSVSGTTTLNGDDGNDSFAILSAHDTTTLNGNAGDDTLVVNLDGLSNGTLTVNGNGENDNLTVLITTIPTTINGGGGNDTVNIQAITAATTVNGETGADTVNVSSDAPTNSGTVNSVSAQLSVNGGDGAETLNVSDASEPADNTGVLTTTTLTGLGMTDGIGFATVETIAVYLGSGNDTVTVQAIPTGMTNLDSSAGNDTLIGPNLPNTWSITGQNAGTLNTTFTFTRTENLTGGTANDTFIFADQMGVGGIVDGGLGSDGLNYDAYTTPVAMSLTSGPATGTGGIRSIENAKLGAGDDQVTINGPLDAPLSIDGGGGSNSLTINTNNAGADTVTLGNTAIDIGQPITYVRFQLLNVNTGDGADTVAIYAAGAGFPNLVDVRTGSGDDRIVIQLGNPLVATTISIDADEPSASDSVIVNGTALTETFSIADAAWWFRAQIKHGPVLTVGATRVNLSSVEDLWLYAGGGNDVVNMHSSLHTTMYLDGGWTSTVNFDGDDLSVFVWPGFWAAEGRKVVYHAGFAHAQGWNYRHATPWPEYYQVVGGQQVVLHTDSPTTLELPDGILVIIPDGIADTASVEWGDESNLRGALPPGYEYVAAVEINVFQRGLLLISLTGGRSLILSFMVPVRFVGRTFAILYWNGTAWVEIPATVMPDGRVIGIGNLPGYYVLAAR